ncbi:SIR2 family protein [Neisseria gonorrhoeae]
MNIKEFMSNYTNHPVLFIGTGMSLRYLDNSYTWDGLLSKIAIDLFGDDREYLNIKSRYCEDGRFQYEEIAEELQSKFDKVLENDPDGRFKEINDKFFENMRAGNTLSRFKIYISTLLSQLNYKDNSNTELSELKKARKNVGSIITTNYDKLAQDIFEFNPLIGNDILLSNPYGSVYKIHGCVDDPSKIIITKKDYEKFKEKYELIRAQLLSLFIHNPIIFLGYNVGDENIKEILKTIFTYVEPNSPSANKIRRNFLLVEYEPESNNEDIVEHDIDITGFSTIRINKIKTDNFSQIYKALAELTLPISAMDVRKFQSIAKEIYTGGNIKVSFTEDMDNLNNSDKVVAIGSTKTISYNFQTTSEMMSNYFKIIEEENSQLLKLIDKHSIASTQYFPIYEFSRICSDIHKEAVLKRQQKEKLDHFIEEINRRCKNNHSSIQSILDDENISDTYKNDAIAWGIWNNQLSEDEVENYLKNFVNKKNTHYKRLLCMFDYKKYADTV